MAKVILPIALVASVIGGSYFYANYKVEVHRGDDGRLQYVQVTPPPRSGAVGPAAKGPAAPAEQPPAAATRSVIRVATFNLGRLDEGKLGNRQVNDVLISVLPQFEIVAVQDIRAANQGVLVRLVERVNATGRQYDFAIPPDVTNGAAAQFSAFLFDKAAIDIDRSTVAPVEDAAGRFQHKPLVALFRVRGPDPAEAFTLKLINVHIEPDRVASELGLLGDVYRAVRDDGQGEDDIVMLGDFGTGDDPLEPFGQRLDLISAVSAGSTTTVRGTRPVDLILLDPRATMEFTGRSEVLDLVREFDLTLREALEVSEHLPVWAEFSSYEGGQARSNRRPSRLETR